MIDDDMEHCQGECASTYDDETGELIDEGGDCAHCECCCDCLGCIYAPRESLGLTEEQRTPIAAMAAELNEAPPDAGSAR